VARSRLRNLASRNDEQMRILGCRHEDPRSIRERSTAERRRTLWSVVGQPQPADATRTPSVAEPVKTAFALGWQMARLFTGPLSSNTEPKLDEDLPGLSDLPAGALVNMGLAQADGALAELGAYLGADVPLPSTEAVRAALASAPPDRDAVRRAILDLHIGLLVDLTAADFRLGKAYGLGRALADTCSSTRGDEAHRRRAVEHHLRLGRALEVVGWLDDLKTVLPAHAGQAVADSLQRWARWAEAIDLSTLDARAVTATVRRLHRCGQRWRAILSGEKDAKDLLEIGDYVSAARGALARAGAIGRSLAVQMWGPLLLAGVLLGVGIWLMVANNSTAQVIAGLGTVAAGLGVTWRSAASSLGHLSFGLGRPLWDAQVDLAVGNQLTPAPQRDYVPGLERPRGRWQRAWRELRTADPEAPRGAPANQQPDQLAEPDDAEQEPGDEDTANRPATPDGAANGEGEVDTLT
jgi:hypothetical protein